MISTIFFDVDETLYEEKNAKVKAEIAGAKALAAETGLTVEETYLAYMDAKREVLSLSETDPDRNNRVKWYERLLDSVDAESISAEELGELYWKTVLDNIKPYPDLEYVLPSLSKKYGLWVLTDELLERQKRKVEALGLIEYFKGIISSEHVGYVKPDVKLFEYALGEADALGGESVMIGDNPKRDIAGANQAKMTSILYRRGKYYYYPLEGDAKPDYEITNYMELPSLLSEINKAVP